ncbi:MAG: anthranilate synthase component I [Planctomycetales bacterium]|nr:anthranilate synthase component I [Planctomycetales bacterium]
MSYTPDRPRFRQLAAGHELVPVYRRLASDTLTPVSGFRKIDRGGSACLFESVIGGEKVGRYSFLAADPYLTISARGQEVTTDGPGGRSTEHVANPLDVLRRQLSAVRAAQLEELPPFVSGAVGYAAYDVIRYSEDLPNAPHDDRGLPDLSFGFYDRIVVFDNVNKTMVVVAMAHIEGNSPAEWDAAYDDACRRVDEFVDQLSSAENSLRPTDIDTGRGTELSTPLDSNFTQAAFEDAVRRCVEYIKAGDIFQVVISQRFAIPIQCDPFEIYRTLRIVNPSPFMFFLRTPETTLVGSSPEILCRVIDGQVTVRPLAGTRPRGATPDEDRKLADELLADPKERAEHVMLVDLGRNDVGRVAKYGSVKLSDVMTIERYSHVMHITSNVTGQLAAGKDAFDALQASLPAGTVSGAPKVRAMEIIDELEPNRRGPYAGAVGHMDFQGNMDTCIALRTIVVQDDTAYVQAGAGIVADSIPTTEYHETLNKARGLLKAIEMTEQRQRESPEG